MHILIINWTQTGIGFAAGMIIASLIYIAFLRKIDTPEERQSFFHLLINATSQESSKRFVVITLILILICVNVVSIILLWLVMFKVLPIPPATIALFFALFNYLLQCDFFIVCFGIGATVVSNATGFLATVFSRKADVALVAAQNKVAENAQNVTVNKEVKQQTINTDTVQNEQPAETGADIAPVQPGNSGTVQVTTE